MSSILNSRDLVKSIKGRAFIPESQETFTQDRLLEIATEEVNIGIMDQIMDARGDYLVYSVDVAIEEGVNAYAIPDRAHGNKLRDAQIVDENGSIIFELSQVTLEEIKDYEGPYSLGAYNVFYLQNNMVMLPVQGSSAGYYLRMWFYMRPNKLVQITRAATATGVPTTYQVDNVDPLSGSITDISVANPTVITSASHGLFSGDTIVISGSDSTPVVDGDYTVTVLDEDTFTVEVDVTVAGASGSWSKTANCVVVSSVLLPSHFTDVILYDIVGGISPNKIKLYNIPANSVSSGAKTITFRVDDVGEDIVVGDYITKAEETIVPNIPTEYHPVLAQRVAVFCLEAMGDEQNKQSAERKLKQMETATLRMISNRVEGAPKKIKNRFGTLNCGTGRYRRGW
jgi:hypothetical protein